MERPFSMGYDWYIRNGNHVMHCSSDAEAWEQYRMMAEAEEEQ